VSAQDPIRAAIKQRQAADDAKIRQLFGLPPLADDDSPADPPSAPRVNAGTGSGQPPARKWLFDDILRALFGK